MIRRIVETTLNSRSFIFESRTQAFWAIVEGVTEWFMDTAKCFIARHEYLHQGQNRQQEEI